VTVRLRGHHLLCMLTYAGKGYSVAFTENFDRICTRLGRGEDIELVDGPDDVCAPLLLEADAHCHEESVTARDRAALTALGDLLRQELGAGQHLRLDARRLAKLRGTFRQGAIRAACAGCEWHDLCSDIAAGGFPDVRLRAG
jgi:hypothetical protein